MKSLVGCMEAMEAQKPYIAMIFVQCVYAGMALFSKAAISQGMNPPLFVFYRQAFATFALAPLAFFLERKKALPLSYKFLFKVFMISLCGITLSLNLFYVAINYTSATFAAATTNTIPAITLVLAALLRFETISIKNVPGVVKLMGAVIGLSGAFVFAFVKGAPLKFMNWYPETQQNAHNSSSSQDYSKGEWIRGSLMMISANATWSLWLVFQGSILKDYAAKWRVTTLQCFFSCLQSGLWGVAMERNPAAWKLGWNLQLFSVAYCGIIVTGMTYWLQIWSVEKKGPVFTAMFTPLSLIITAIFSALLWKETLHWGSFGGAVLLVAGLYCVLWGKNREDDGKRKANEQTLDSKEEIVLECITHH